MKPKKKKRTGTANRQKSSNLNNQRNCRIDARWLLLNRSIHRRPAIARAKRQAVGDREILRLRHTETTATNIDMTMQLKEKIIEDKLKELSE